LTWTFLSGNFPQELFLATSGEIYGTPSFPGVYSFSVRVSDGNNFADTNVTLTISGNGSPLQVLTTFLPNGTNGLFYTQTFQASGGQPPYLWSIPSYSTLPPPNLVLATNGVLSGLPASNGTFAFYVRVTDSTSAFADSDAISLTIYPAPLVITNVLLPVGTIGAPYNAQLGATGGQKPYNCWSLAPGSASLPPGLGVSCSGLISGNPTAAGTFNFLVQISDANATTKTKPLGITINPKPVLTALSWRTNRFQMQLTGVTNQNYTLQFATNLSVSNWFSLFSTNNQSTNSFLIADPNATNKQRFYRLLLGP
jgi:hypothetical protein